MPHDIVQQYVQIQENSHKNIFLDFNTFSYIVVYKVCNYS